MRLSNKFSIGAGLEYSRSPLHKDNGWNLYHLQFFPVYLSETYTLKPEKRFPFFIHAEEGISFNSYKKEDQSNPGPRFRVNERGFFGSNGAGISTKLNNNVNFAAEAGFKGFHISANALDVNPHGITGMLSIAWHLPD